MKHVDWSELKNTKLKAQRGLCFEYVQTAIEENDVLDDIIHPNQELYNNQRILIVKIKDYAYLVPYVEDETKIFLKTVIPSRKATNKYLRRK
jgi:hypothetical protein